MIETILFYIHSALLLICGVLVSCSLARIKFTKANLLTGTWFILLSGIVQLLVLYYFGESAVWNVYPLIVHVPLMLLFLFKYKRSFPTSIACVASAYMCCQPANWYGLVAYIFSESIIICLLVEILTLLGFTVLLIYTFSPVLSKLLQRNDISTITFGIIPIVYYIFDYMVAPSIDTTSINNRVVFEFMPFFICIIYLVLSFIYYREHEMNVASQMKNQIIKTAYEQQIRELELMKSLNHEMRLIRHDLRFFLNTVALKIQNQDTESALKMISEYIELVDNTSVIRYCQNDTINYILSAFVQKCEKMQIELDTNIKLSDFQLDEIILSSILSNALDNAFNAVKDIPLEKRKIKVMIKTSEQKILISVKNPYEKKPVFVDGLPVANQQGHGYGTQSICFLTERLKGNVQFSADDGWFSVRIII